MVIKIEIKMTKTKENRNTATTSVTETGEKKSANYSRPGYSWYKL